MGEACASPGSAECDHLVVAGVMTVRLGGWPGALRRRFLPAVLWRQ